MAHGLLRTGILALCGTLAALGADQVKTVEGLVETTAAPVEGVRIFKGIPFAQAPVGALRWTAPQPMKPWEGVKNADQFGPRCMQRTGPGADYWFRSNGMSEDCLYLNVWTPAKSGKAKLPVLVYVFGGGFQNGDGSEPRYDGENMARQGIVAVSINYRLNVFGFFSHPELTAESAHKASGNQGLLDQAAALAWVQRNIAAFGGDPKRVTIAGESAGSMSVSALMSSPVSRGLIAGAIGESGAMLGGRPYRPLAESEKDGEAFTKTAGAANLAALRALSAEQIQEFSTKGGPGLRFWPTIDGYYLPKSLKEIFAAREQAKIPLMAGSNTEEQGYRAVLGAAEATPENFAAALKRLYGEKAESILRVYGGGKTAEEIQQAATDLASARFIGHGTYLWGERQAESGQPVYRYMYAKSRPKYLPAGDRATAAKGAVHSAEIQYAMGNLKLDNRYAWEDSDYTVSKTIQAYFLNFIKKGNPNGKGLPKWPKYKAPSYERMRIDVVSKSEKEPERARYAALDAAQ